MPARYPMQLIRCRPEADIRCDRFGRPGTGPLDVPSLERTGTRRRRHHGGRVRPFLPKRSISLSNRRRVLDIPRLPIGRVLDTTYDRGARGDFLLPRSHFDLETMESPVSVDFHPFRYGLQNHHQYTNEPKMTSRLGDFLALPKNGKIPPNPPFSRFIAEYWELNQRPEPDSTEKVAHRGTLRLGMERHRLAHYLEG